MKPRMKIYVLLSLLLGPSAFAEVMPWKEARELAIERNPSLASAFKAWESSKAGVKEAWGNFLPELSLSARRTRTETELSFVETKSRSRLYSVAASWNLFSGFAHLAALNGAEALRSESAANRDTTSAELRYQLRRAYFSVYVQQERIKLFERILKRQQQNEKLVSLKYNSGTEARWNVLKSTADRERAELNLRAAQNELASARDTLARHLHLPALPAEKVTDASGVARMDLPPIIPGDDTLERHPELAASRFSEERAGAERLAARASFFPVIDLSYSRSRDQNEIGARPRSDSNTFAVTAQWNLFNGLSDYYNLQQANIAKEAARLDTEALARRLLNGLRSAYFSLSTALAQIPVARSAREAAEERVRIVSAQYRSGLKSYLDWEQAETRLLEVEQQEISALSSALQALADFERAKGVTLEEP